jgi:hypothetical protein
MSSRRRLRRKACEGKMRHETQAQAVAHAIHLYRKTGEQMQSYHCRFCRRWHVGHAKQRHGCKRA